MSSCVRKSQGLPIGRLFGNIVATMGMLNIVGYVLIMDMFGSIVECKWDCGNEPTSMDPHFMVKYLATNLANVCSVWCNGCVSMKL
jgi:hypothetical protein